MALVVRGSTRPAATAVVSLSGGRQTVVAVSEGKRVKLRVYRDRRARPGRVALRAIHAAAEIDAADLRVGGRTVARDIEPGSASSYASIEPGMYDLSATRPGGGGGALVAMTQASLVAGTTTTAVLVGSGGKPAQIILAQDGSSGPRTAPGTGLGPGQSSRPWLIVALAGLLAGSVGGAAYMLAVRRARDA